MFQQEQYMQPPVLERSAPLTNDTGDDDDDYDPPMLQENVGHIDNANFNLIKKRNVDVFMPKCYICRGDRRSLVHSCNILL